MERRQDSLQFIDIRAEMHRPPRGRGNIAALSDTECSGYARGVVDWLRALEVQTGGVIEAIAVDAPSAPAISAKRACELALDARRWPYITTPTAATFDQIRLKCIAHLAQGNAAARLPHANQLWMLIGFALFKALLHKGWNVIEVYPNAILRAFNPKPLSKHSEEGIEWQLKVVSEYVGIDEKLLRAQLAKCVYGSLHDRLDAFMSAWVASLSAHERIALGNPPNDAIWIPIAQNHR